MAVRIYRAPRNRPATAHANLTLQDPDTAVVQGNKGETPCIDIVIRRGELVDGTGAEPVAGDLYRTATTSSPSSRDELPKSSVSPSCSP